MSGTILARCWITVVAAVSYLRLTRTYKRRSFVAPLRRWSSLQDLCNKSGVKRVTSHANTVLVYLQIYFGYRGRGNVRILGEHAKRADISETAKYRLMEYTRELGGIRISWFYSRAPHTSSCIIVYCRYLENVNFTRARSFSFNASQSCFRRLLKLTKV